MFLQILTALVLLLLTRIYLVLSNPSSKPRQRRDGETCALGVFLGSGLSYSTFDVASSLTDAQSQVGTPVKH